MGATGAQARRRVGEEVERACREAQDATALHRQAMELLHRAVPFDARCSMTLDPSTLLDTGGYHEQGLPRELLPRLLDIEHGAEDVGTLRRLAAAPVPVATLARSTGGDPERSARYRDVLAPAGVPQELRALLRSEDRVWGALVLMRDGQDFSDDEVDLVERLVPALARGTRRALALASVRAGIEDPGAGLLLVRPTPTGVDLVHASEAATAWLSEVEDTPLLGSALPVVVRSLVASVADPATTSRCRVRTRSGRWLTLHAEATADGTVAVLVAPSRPPEVAAVLADAHGLTRRECEVVLLVARGASTSEIARLLWVSPYTVQDHLKKVFEKLGVNSRGELTSRLFFDQYLPRLSEGDEPGWDGWFVGRA